MDGSSTLGRCWDVSPGGEVGFAACGWSCEHGHSLRDLGDCLGDCLEVRLFKARVYESTQEVGWSQGMLLKKIHLRSFKIGALESFSSWNATHQVVQPLPSNHGICCPAAQRASIFGGSVSWAPNGNLWNGSIQVHPCFANGIGRLGWTHPSIGSTIIAGKRMSNGHNYCNTNLVLLRLGLSEVAQNLHNR